MGLSKLSKKVEDILRQECEEWTKTLNEGETFRLDHRARMLRVNEGRIWITWGDEDFVIDTGEDIMFPSGTDAVISVLNVEEATFELLCIPKSEAKAHSASA